MSFEEINNNDNFEDIHEEGVNFDMNENQNSNFTFSFNEPGEEEEEDDDNNFYFTPEQTENEENIPLPQQEQNKNNNEIEQNTTVNIEQNNNKTPSLSPQEIHQQAESNREIIEENKPEIKIDWNEDESNLMQQSNLQTVINEEDMNLFQRIIFHQPFKGSQSFVAVFLALLIITFEILLMGAGFYLGYTNTFLFCLLLFPFQLFWFYITYFRTEEKRSSTPSPRVLETFSISFFIESFLFIIERAFWYGTVILLFTIDDYFNQNTYLLWVLILIWIIFISFGVQAVLEQSSKYFMLYRNSKSFGFQTRYSVVIYSISSSLAISLFTGTMATVLIYWTDGFKYAMATLFIEGFLTTTMHVITGTWISIAYLKLLFRSDSSSPSSSSLYDKFLIIFPAVFMQGCYSSLISALRLLFAIDEITWKLYVAVVIAATILLLVVLFFTVRKAKKILADPHLYQPLSSSSV